MTCDRKNSKRSVLQTASKLFDPMGIASPFIVLIKLLMQEIWELGLGWDDELSTDLKKKWDNWCSQIYLLKDLTIERKYFSIPWKLVKELELHIFSDASPKAFGAVAYFRYVSSDDCIYTSFITAKSRIAPLKRLTLPRLELMGAVISSRLFQYLKTNFKFPVPRVYMWTDSLIALHWIKGKASKWKPFVSNRVSEIQSRTDPADWNHCSGQDNPADFISRGATVEKFMSSSIWMQGPEWLRLKKRDWPKGSNYEICLEISPEVYCEKRSKLEEVSSFVCEVQSNLTHLMDLNRYSSLRKLYRVTSWILRFIYNLKFKTKRCGELSTEELNEAEIIWTKTVQSEAFAEELSSLRQGKTISKTSSILELNPFLNNDGIMHVGGRLQKSRLSYLQRHPIIMPSKHHFVNLLVWDAHSKVFHGGISETLIEIRERYWIIKGRQTVKNILRKCILCKRFNSSPGVQVTAPLPVNRTEELPPFSVVGIDFGEPLYTKDSDEKKLHRVVYLWSNASSSFRVCW
ncbi:uncharacterized protein LOC118197929 [Stegodyphus dumicola]|uniref:uncharacterized protein LOC118197929 n=1 Tax=Stegodyphus dumicola TaxID=202533 RepID=UPI0015B23857|nr:uncharacterized protein LOC118197929 [Stegodyphus dumicola]